MPETDAGHVRKKEAKEAELIGDVVAYKATQVRESSESCAAEYIDCVNAIKKDEEDLWHIRELREILERPNYAKETTDALEKNIFKKTMEKNRLLAILHRLGDSTVSI
jgi:hypothetical protein